MKTLLVLTLSGSVLALLLLLLRYVLLKKMPSTVYYYAWLLVLLRFVLPLPGLIPSVPAPVSTTTAVSAVSAAPVSPENTGRRDAVLPSADVGNRPAPVERSTAAESQQEAAVTAPSVIRTFNWRSPALWLTIWAAGALGSFGFSVFSYLRFTRRLENGLREPPRAVLSVYRSLPGRKPELYLGTMKTPMMYGLFRPRIVLPDRSYSRETLENILHHELTHYRRRDTLYKWAAVVILSLHWFNPLTRLIRRELNRACELSCDEMLLRRMDRAAKQSYGETLLSMAASSALPAGVVATTFSTEKKNLKERLEQIMHYKKHRLSATILAVLLLLCCGTAAGLYPQRASAGIAEVQVDNTVTVSTVDEFLSAIAPNTTIQLQAGTYDLSTASNYGQDSHSSWYSWDEVYGEEGRTHAELVIHSVDGLTISGAGLDSTTLAAVPRYADVLRFQNCHDLRVENLTAGHTTEPGYCTGGVLRLENCGDAEILSCGLYGCGTVGVDALDTSRLSIRDCHIYECSYYAVSLNYCRDVEVENCDVDRFGLKGEMGSAMGLFYVTYSDGVVIHGSRVSDSAVQYLLNLSYTKNAAFLSNEVYNNRFESSVFVFDQYGPTIDGCAFHDNGTIRSWVQSSGVYANDVDGNLLSGEDFASMSLREIDPKVVVTPATVASATEVRPGGSIEVTTVDELLAAIGPDRTVILDGELFDLSTAVNYGSVGSEYYYWQESYDGPQLVIRNVSGLTLQAKSSDPKATTLAAIPRYANVLAFVDCSDLNLIGFTAGHTKEPGSCSGGVLDFQNCHDVRIEEMRLYGCGILGIQASYSTSLNVLRTEIFECSQGAGMFFQCDGVLFTDCDVHDVPSPAFSFTECGDLRWNGEPVSPAHGDYDVDADGTLIPFVYEGEEFSYDFAIEDLVNPFANDPVTVLDDDAPRVLFAKMVQSAIVEGDLEALADRVSFPMQFFTDGTSWTVHTREELINLTDPETGNSPFTRRVRERFANASVNEFGSCVFGDTCLDHLVAFGNYGSDESEASMFINAISIVSPFWPGRAETYAQAVPPTPEV